MARVMQKANRIVEIVDNSNVADAHGSVFTLKSLNTLTASM